MKVKKRYRQLLDFIVECDKSGLEKKVLDCGAGGSNPPLAIFHEKGYETFGIEISTKQLENAREFEKSNNINLNIIEGDMRDLPYENESFSFVYSYISIYHMKKIEIKRTISEMARVLIPGGLLYINVPSIKSKGYDRHKEEEKGEFRGKNGEIHSLFEENELDSYFTGLTIIKYRKRNFGIYIRMIDYIIKK